MTPIEQTNRSQQILVGLNGLHTGDVITVLALALQMAICYGARNKEDAMHMIDCILADAKSDMPEHYEATHNTLRGRKLDA